MSDREMLEFAAWAAGYAGFSHCESVDGESALYIPSLRGIWNPLFDGTDCLNLAIKLDIQIIPGNGYVETVKIHRKMKVNRFAESHKQGKTLATRRAIVRCAAALGELK